MRPGRPFYKSSTHTSPQGLTVKSLGVALAIMGANLLATPHTLASETKTTPSAAASASVTHTSHGFSLYGDLKYGPKATHLEYANPDAPKGGRMRLMATGTFDTLNPYVLKGLAPWKTPGLFVYGFGQLHDSLLAGTSSMRTSGDEPQSAYGLIASSVTYPDDFSWVSFTLRPEATFHDGHPITAEDVVFSLNLLKEKGHPSYAIPLQAVTDVTAIDDLTVKISFKTKNQRHLLLRVGATPILPKHTLTDKDFESTGLTPILGNGPYRVATFDSGRQVVLERVKDYWAKDLWLNKGLYNFDNIVIDFYRDQTVAFEAFKAGEYDVHLEYVSKNWANNYDFKALHNGEVIKTELPHKQAQGSQAFFFNTRKSKFKDRRVREAIAQLFNFEWSNEALFNGAYRRSNTFFPNSPFAATGLPSQLELTLLKAYEQNLPNSVFNQAFALPVTDGTNNLRKERRRAHSLLKSAGYRIQNNKLINIETGEPFTFELVNQTSPSLKRVILPFKKNLERLGIDMAVRMIDATQYKERLDRFDFDMTIHVLGQSLAPGDNPFLYFHSSVANEPGSRNISGIENPAVDALVTQLKTLKDFDEVTTTMRALDRILLWEFYTIPHWYIDYHRIAWWDQYEQPKVRPDYILGTQTWWQKTATTSR